MSTTGAILSYRDGLNVGHRAGQIRPESVAPFAAVVVGTILLVFSWKLLADLLARPARQPGGQKRPWTFGATVCFLALTGAVTILLVYLVVRAFSPPAWALAGWALPTAVLLGAGLIGRKSVAVQRLVGGGNVLVFSAAGCACCVELAMGYNPGVAGPGTGVLLGPAFGVGLTTAVVVLAVALAAAAREWRRA